MKRSRLPARREPLKRSQKRIRARRSKPRRTFIMRDRKYLDWLKERNCVACVQQDLAHGTRVARFFDTDPAHGPSAGARLKGPDNEAVPLCRYHHSEQHDIGWPAFEGRYGFSREREARAHFKVYLIAMEAQL